MSIALVEFFKLARAAFLGMGVLRFLDICALSSSSTVVMIIFCAGRGGAVTKGTVGKRMFFWVLTTCCFCLGVSEISVAGGFSADTADLLRRRFLAFVLREPILGAVFAAGCGAAKVEDELDSASESDVSLSLLSLLLFSTSLSDSLLSDELDNEDEVEDEDEDEGEDEEDEDEDEDEDEESVSSMLLGAAPLFRLAVPARALLARADFFR